MLVEFGPDFLTEGEGGMMQLKRIICLFL